MNHSHLAFTDEKDYNQGRYRGVALVSLSVEGYVAITRDLRAILDESGVSEFGWKVLKSAKYQFAAEKLVRYAIEQVNVGRLRIDVLVWDSKDNRHSIKMPDEIGNLCFMYFHLFRNVVRMRYPSDATWLLRPDEHNAIDWGIIDDRLKRRSVVVDDELPLVSNSNLLERLRQEYSVAAIQEARSVDEPLVQLADLFVGLGCFSRAHYEEYAEWEVQHSAQMSLFAIGETSTPSSSAKHRFPVVKLLNELCKGHRLGVSLKSHRGFRTLKPDGPINFWWYEAQHEDDMASSRM